MIRQLAASAENLVASPQFLVALATSESQFQALREVFFFYFAESLISELVNHFPEIKIGSQGVRF